MSQFLPLATIAIVSVVPLALAVTETVICVVFCVAEPKEHAEVKGVCIDAWYCVAYQIPLAYEAILKFLYPVGLEHT